MLALDLRLLPDIALAADKAGQLAGLTRHAWILATLDRAAALPYDTGQGQRTPHHGRPRSARVKLWLSDDRARAYAAAAAECGMNTAAWATAVIGVASGQSALQEQLERIG